MSGRETCVNCGERREPTDLARINDAPLCHGFLDPEPTCYMRMQRMLVGRHPLTDALLPPITPITSPSEES